MPGVWFWMPTACGTSSDGEGVGSARNQDEGNDNQTFESYGEFLDAYYVVLCDYLKRCAGIDVEASYTWNYCTDNRADLVAAFGLDQARVNIDSSEAQRCLTNARRDECNFNPLDPVGCEHVIVGTVAADGACTTSVECLPDLYCDQTSMCPGKCAPRAALGENCTLEECTRGLACIDDSCVQEPADGAPCLNGRCAVTSACRNDICVRMVPYSVDIGEACESSIECHGANYCDSTGICAQEGVTGSACNTVPCSNGFYCDAGTCQPERSDGQACVESSQCASANCTEATCQARGLLAAPCSTDQQCLSYNCGAQGQCVPLLSCE